MMRLFGTRDEGPAYCRLATVGGSLVPASPFSFCGLDLTNKIASKTNTGKHNCRILYYMGKAELTSFVGVKHMHMHKIAGHGGRGAALHFFSSFRHG